MKIGRAYVKYISLSVLGMIGLSLYILADTYFISNKLGADGLTSLNLALPLYGIINGIGLMLGVGGATRYSILNTQQGEQKNQPFTAAISMGIVFGLCFVIAGLFFNEPIARLLGANDEVIGLTSIYLKVVCCFAPFFIVNNILVAFTRNDKSPKHAMTAMLLGSLFNIVMDYILMYPFNLGMFGAAFATGLAPIIGICICLSRKRGFHFSGKPSFHELKRLVPIGTSSFITEFSSTVVMLTFNFLILKMAGNIGVAAYGIVANIALVATAIFTGVSQGIQPLCSSAYAKNDKIQMRQLLRYGAFTVLGLGIIIYATSWSLATPLADMFGGKDDVQLSILASEGIRLYFLTFLIAGFNVLLITYMAATEQARKSILFSAFRGVIFIVLFAIILSSIFGMTGIWLSMLFTELVTLIIMLTTLFIKKQNVLISK